MSETSTPEKSASEQIDNIIGMRPGWKGELLAQLRKTITSTSPDITEEIKWRMANRPEGLAVWAQNGILCFAEIWKDNIKLLFPKGASLEDPDHLFNSRLESKDIRAIEFKEGAIFDGDALSRLVSTAIALNISKPYRLKSLQQHPQSVSTNQQKLP